MKEEKMRFKILTKLKRFVSKLYRKKIQKNMRGKLEISSSSIIASNCIGGLLCHDLGFRFDSPTVNLFFDAVDFIKFCENLEYYLNVTLTPECFIDDNSRHYPVALLKDIHIYFVHYKAKEEAIYKWETRKKRIDINNLKIIFTDRNGLTEDLLNRFLKLPYKKIVFVSKKSFVLSKECIFIPGFKDNGCVPEADKVADWFGQRYYEKYFDIVTWINGNE